MLRQEKSAGSNRVYPVEYRLSRFKRHVPGLAGTPKAQRFPERLPLVALLVASGSASGD